MALQTVPTAKKPTVVHYKMDMLSKLSLTNYRNHKKLELALKPDITLIVGPNGIGKTNILEAIHLLSTTKPYRAHYDKDVISYQADFAKIAATIKKNGDKDELILAIKNLDALKNTSIKKATVNGVAKTLYSFAGMLNTVLFAPEDIEMITDSPTLRRKYMDSVLIQVDKAYKKSLAAYTKALRQRNKLLRLMWEHNKGYDQIEYWNDLISVNGRLIQQKRADMFDFLGQELKGHMHEFEQKLDVSLKYVKNEISTERLLEYKMREMAAKTSLIGPHRDNFEIFIDTHNIAYFGSRGQQRAALLALKLAEMDFFEKKTGARPLLLLDDIFSELDRRHKEIVFDVIGKQQTIITSTEELTRLTGYTKIEF